MEVLLSVAKLFNASPARFKFTETFDDAVLKVSISPLTIPTESEVRKSFSAFFPRDVVHCDVKIGENDPISLHSTQLSQISEFLTMLVDVSSVAENSTQIHLEISVEKRIIDNRLTIFSLDAFAKHLENTPLKTLLIQLSEILANRERLYCICQETIAEFHTESLWFENSNLNRAITPPPKSRNLIFAKRNEVCHFENSSEVRTIPEDFFLEIRSTNPDINKSFDKLCTATSFVFICDIAQFEGETLIFFKLNGYKAITGKLDFKNISNAVVETYFKIYQWIYEGGVINDKIGLARNLLSLHAKKGNFLELEADVFTSIRSGYQIYLKQNVKQYIELKNKLLDFLTELSKKGAKLGEDLGDKLGKNFVAFASFFLSVVVVKAVSVKDFTGNFSLKLAAIAYALLIASLIHWVVSLLFLNREIGQMEKSYLGIQKRYDDLLDPEDLANVFSNNDEYQSVIDNIKYKRKLYSGAWVGYIVLFGILVAFLTVTDKAAKSQASPITPVAVTNYIVVSNSLAMTNPIALTNLMITSPIFITNSVAITNPAAANPASPKD